MQHGGHRPVVHHRRWTRRRGWRGWLLARRLRGREDWEGYALSSGTGLGGYSGEGGATIRWKLTNNIIFSEGSRGSAADVGSTRIVSSGNNLFFGYASNTPRPAPVSSTGDDTSGTAVMGTVFQDAARGDFRPRAGGPAVGTGLNVHGLGPHGSVTTDLAQQPRPPEGTWDRGALRY